MCYPCTYKKKDIEERPLHMLLSPIVQVPWPDLGSQVNSVSFLANGEVKNPQKAKARFLICPLKRHLYQGKRTINGRKRCCLQPPKRDIWLCQGPPKTTPRLSKRRARRTRRLAMPGDASENSGSSARCAATSSAMRCSSACRKAAAPTSAHWLQKLRGRTVG